MTSKSIESLKIKAKLLQKKKIASGEDYPLKQAYATIASTSGFGTWKEMKDSLELSDKLNPPRWSAIWKHWVSTHEEGLKFLKPDLFLLPYRNQFFICTMDYVNALGIASDDPDLLKVGNDWSKPIDNKALDRILKKL